MTIDESTTATAKELGAVLGVTARRVRQLAEEGVFPRTERGRYPLAACVQAYVTQIATDADPADLKLERIELMRAQRRRIEQDLADRQASAEELDSQDRLIQTFVLEARKQVQFIPAWLHGELHARAVTVQGMTEPARELALLVERWCVGIQSALERHFTALAAEARRKNVLLIDWHDVERLELPQIDADKKNGNGHG